MLIEDEAILSTLEEFLISIKADNHFVQTHLKIDPEATIVITGVNECIYNSVFIKNPTSTHKFIDEVINLKNNIGKPLTLWITPETHNGNLEYVFKEHFKSPGPFYGMMLDLSKANLGTYSQNIVITEVKDATEADIFANLLSDIFNFPNIKDTTRIWAINQLNAEIPASFNYLARVDGVLAGACSLVFNNEFKQFKTGGLYNACVLPSFRKNGIGTAMAYHRIKVAKQMGIKNLSIILMSDAMARGYCQRLGFIDYNTLTPFFIA